MNHTSPYALLSVLDDRNAAPTVDLRALAERWNAMRPSLPPQAAPVPPQAYHPFGAPAPALPPRETAPSSGPRMRTPAPMYPPAAYPPTALSNTAYPNTAYPSGIPTYNSAPQPTRHAHYDAILEQHRNASKKAVFTNTPIE